MPSARYDIPSLEAAYELPDAGSLAPGSIVLGASGTDRTALRWGFILWSSALVVGGVAIGYYFGRKA